METMNNTDSFDMIKMLEKAKYMAEFMKEGSSPEGEKEQDAMDIEKIKKAYEMATKFKEIMTRTEPVEDKNEESNNFERISQNDDTRSISAQGFSPDYFNSFTDTPALQSIKAALPYLEFKYRRNLAIFIKLIEIQRLLDAYGNAVSSIQTGSGGDFRRAILQCMRPYLSDSNRRMLDSMLKIMDIRNLLSSCPF